MQSSGGHGLISILHCTRGVAVAYALCLQKQPKLGCFLIPSVLLQEGSRLFGVVLRHCTLAHDEAVSLLYSWLFRFVNYYGRFVWSIESINCTTG